MPRYHIDRRIGLKKVGEKFHLYVDGELQVRGSSGEPRAYKDERTARSEGRKIVRKMEVANEPSHPAKQATKY